MFFKKYLVIITFSLIGSCENIYTENAKDFHENEFYYKPGEEVEESIIVISKKTKSFNQPISGLNDEIPTAWFAETQAKKYDALNRVLSSWIEDSLTSKQNKLPESISLNK